MKQMVMAVGMALFGMGTVFADTTPNLDPTPMEKTQSAVVAVVNALSPGYDTLYDLKHGEWFQGVSASVWNFKSQSIPIASVRLGYAIDKKLYGAERLDLPGLSQRFVPATIKGIATQGYLDTFWKLVGKYASVGAFQGYDNDRRQLIVGINFGVAGTF